MNHTQLYFNKEDECLNLKATVSWRDRDNVSVPDLSIRGFGKWRHLPANMLACSSRAIDLLKLDKKGQRLSKIGLNYIGVEAKSDIFISKAIRESKTGTEKVKALLTKFFVKGLGASSIKFEIPEA